MSLEFCFVEVMVYSGSRPSLNYRRSSYSDVSVTTVCFGLLNEHWRGARSCDEVMATRVAIYCRGRNIWMLGWETVNEH